MVRKLPNDNFIDFLAVYGPWNNGVVKYDEYVAQAAARYEIKPFEFKLPRQKQYMDALEKLVRNNTSQVVLINGNAGDGKTHFLQKLLFDLGIFASPEDQKQAIEAAQDDRLLFVQKPNINFTIVKDLSDTDKSPELITKLFSHVCNILLAAYKPSHAAHFLQKPHIVIIAGNNGKILQCFKQNLDPTLNPVLELLEQQMLDTGRTKTTALADSNTASTAPTDLDAWHVSLLDMASCLNDEAVKEIWHTIVENESWSKCADCSSFEHCPICRNREALASPLVLQRFLDLYTIIHDESEHLTIRSLLLLLSNALLGKYQSSRADGFYTCRKVRNLTTKINKSNNKEAAEALPLPFDNLMGLNLSTRYQEKADVPVFKQLSLIGLGEHSLQAIDTFLLYGHDNVDLGWSDAYDKLFTSYAARDLITRLQSAILALKETQDSADNSSDSALSQAQAKVQRTLASLRRLSFFTFESNSSHKAIFNPFVLSGFAYGEQYLALKKHLGYIERQLYANANSDFSEYGNQQDDLDFYQDYDKVERSLIVGLNRAFTHLMVVSNQDEVFVSNNNKLNPTAFCVVYGSDMKLSVSFNAPSSNKLGFGLSGSSKQPLAERLMVIRYIWAPSYQPTVEADQSSLATVELTLTPKMFEYLMSLAHGKMAISFSQECHEDLNAFKDNLTVTLVDTAGRDYKQQPTESLARSLKHIEICDVDSLGSIINNSAY